MTNPVDTSVIISVYNNAEWLSMIFDALARQTVRDFEAVVADDGSGPAIAGVIRAAQAKYGFPIVHVWHEDRGFRKNTILNRAVEQSRGDYLIFIDGDCVPEPGFIADHRRYRQPGTVIAGRRCDLPPQVSKGFSPRRIRTAAGRTGLFIKALWYGTRNHERYTAENYIRLASPAVRRFIKPRMASVDNPGYGILGCNFSLYKETMLAVNGFDERFQSPFVGEDTDLNARLLRAGFAIRILRHLARVYHRHHARLESSGWEQNDLLYQENGDRGVTYTPYGIVRGAFQHTDRFGDTE